MLAGMELPCDVGLEVGVLDGILVGTVASRRVLCHKSHSYLPVLVGQMFLAFLYIIQAVEGGSFEWSSMISSHVVRLKNYCNLLGLFIVVVVVVG